jgi:S1-C subfamily serine protease
VPAAVRAVAPSVAAVEALRPLRGRPTLAPAHASAVVIDPAGYLATNQHVVDGARQLRVTLADGNTRPATVVGGDPVTDVAVVRVAEGGLPAARIGRSDELAVGQFVIAVGHALGLPGSPTVSLGVISALDRPLPGADFVFEGVIQTDAAINPGHSGGPLADLDGAVVGLNTAVIPTAQGVGFCLPIQAVVRIARELRERGRVVRPWVGAHVVDLRPELAAARGLPPYSGVLVVQVVARSPAHQAGIRPHDRIDRVGRFPVARLKEFLEALSRYPVGGDVEIGLRRRGESIGTMLPLRERPPAVPPPTASPAA